MVDMRDGVQAIEDMMAAADAIEGLIGGADEATGDLLRRLELQEWADDLRTVARGWAHCGPARRREIMDDVNFLQAVQRFRGMAATIKQVVVAEGEDAVIPVDWDGMGGEIEDLADKYGDDRGGEIGGDAA